MKEFINKETGQVNILDERFYHSSVTDRFYPSVTEVLSIYPKGAQFKKWLQANGFNADILLKEAGNFGSSVHGMIETYLRGNRVSWFNQDWQEKYSLEEWESFLKFTEFFEQYNPEIEAVEIALISDSLRVGGTLDFVCKINGERWLIDHKTSNSIYDTLFIQQSVYVQMWNEKFPEKPIDRVGLMWLKSLTRGEAKGKIQGKGWQLKESDESMYYWFGLWEHTRAIYDHENPDAKPKNLIYPVEKSIQTIKTANKSEFV